MKKNYDAKTRQLIEYTALTAINNSLYNDGLIDENTKLKINRLLENNYTL